MPARRRKRNVAVNTKLMIDVISASLIVQKAPDLLSSFMELSPTVAKVAGAGAGYLTGVMLKRPDISNASLALAVVDFVAPMVDDLIGSITTPSLPDESGNGNGNGNQNGRQGALGPPEFKRNTTTDDFITLNDYIANPSIRMPAMAYRDSY